MGKHNKQCFFSEADKLRGNMYSATEILIKTLRLKSDCIARNEATSLISVLWSRAGKSLWVPGHSWQQSKTLSQKQKRKGGRGKKKKKNLQITPLPNYQHRKYNKNLGEAQRTAQQVKALAAEPNDLSSDRNLQGPRRRPTPTGCPLTSTHIRVHMTSHKINSV